MADGSAIAGTKTTCPYCGVGCGVEAARGGPREVSVAGDAQHPANFGKLCSKGTALGKTVSLEGRLLHPEIGGRRVSWEKAARHVGKALKKTIARYGPDSVAFYVSGQLLTEDYYAANKLMKGFIGSGNIDTNSRLCMASAVMAHKQTFGGDLVPGCYEDLEQADLIVFTGHNAAWTHPVLVRRMEQAKARGQKWVCIDPRRTDTAEMSDLHLGIASQSDVRLWNGLLAYLIERGAVDRDYIRAHVNGFEAAAESLRGMDQSPAAVAADCGISEDELRAFYRLFEAHQKTVTLFSMGANQSAQGVAKGIAVINAHLATGRIGKSGAAPFSITGQPNAMGGRETGGMATTLAAHMDFTDAEKDRVRRFWGSKSIAPDRGLKAVDMFDAVHSGKVKAIWIMATNPAVSMPDAGLVREALDRCPLVIVSEAMAQTDTTAYAHVKLPALTWGERDGTVTNSERRISRQRPLFEAPGEAKSDWAIVSMVAREMGFGDAFDWRDSSDVFREYARLTVFENTGQRMLNLGPWAAWRKAAYDAMRPVQWPVTEEGGTPRLFTDGVFQTPDGRARMIPVEPRPPAEATSGGFPLSLNTGRLRDHWHTMTRTGLVADLCQHAPEPYIDMHAEDAAAAHLADGDLTRIVTPYGEAAAVARITDRQRRGDLFMPMHFTAAFAPAGRSNQLIGRHRDAASGQPEFKHTPARIAPWRETWRGFLIAKGTRTPGTMDLVWRRVPKEGCELLEFAGRGDETEREKAARLLTQGVRGEPLVYEDPATGAVRRAWIENGRLERLFFATVGGKLPPRDWLVGLFGKEQLDPQDRIALLAGRPLGPVEDVGAQVCACMRVGARTIEKAIVAGAGDVDAVGRACGAGTNCGSCRPEIARMLLTHSPGPKETLHAA